MTERPTFDLTADDLDTAFKLPAEGWHEVTIDDAEEDTNSKGNLQYLVKYKALDGESFKGTQWDFVTVTKPAIQNIISLMRAVGLKTPTKENPGKLEMPDVDDLIGKDLQIEIIHEDDYKGTTDEEGNVIQRAKVRFAGRKKIGEKTGTPASKTGKAGAKAPAGKAAPKAKAAAGGFAV